MLAESGHESDKGAGNTASTSWRIRFMVRGHCGRWQKWGQGKISERGLEMGVAALKDSSACIPKSSKMETAIQHGSGTHKPKSYYFYLRPSDECNEGEDFCVHFRVSST